MKALLALISLSVFSATIAPGQAPEAPFGVRVTAVSEGNPDHERLEQEILDVVRRQLREAGIPTQGRFQVTLLIDAVQDGPDERIVLSVTRMVALPQEVLELGAREEAFYLSLSANELPPEGAHVRQYVSRDWLEQFHHVADQDLRVFAAERLEAEIADVLAGLPAP